MPDAAKPAAAVRGRAPRPARSAELSWNLIQSFLAVLDTGSLLAASRQRRTTQPTIGRHIEALEGQLGVLLFDRTARGLVATAHAHRIAGQARQMQAGADQITSIAAGHTEQEQMTVRVSASEMVALHVLPASASRLTMLAPEVKLAVVASDQVVNLLRRDADIAIRMVKPTQSSLIARRIGEIRLLACAAQSHIDRWGLPDSIQSLMRQPFVLPDQDQIFRRFLSKSGLTIDSFNVALRSDSYPMNWEAVSIGLGVGVAPEFMIKRSPHVHALPVSLPVPPLPVWLAVHRELRTNPKIRLVFDFLASELAQTCSESR